MSLSLISKEDLGYELEILTNDGYISKRGVAEIFRRGLSRWGLSPRRAIIRYVKEHFEMAGLTDKSQIREIGFVLDRLQLLGECQEVLIGNERYVAPCFPRWLDLDEKIGVVLNVNPIPDGIALIDSNNPEDIVRRIRVCNENDQALLHVEGVKKITLKEWLGPLQYLKYVRKRKSTLIKNEDFPMQLFWELLNNSLLNVGLRLSNDSELRILSGQPNSFFGYHEPCNGRWSKDLKNGIWCGLRKGYGENHWYPIVINIDNNEGSILDLYNKDEWSWALLARGLSTGNPETISQKGNEVTINFPPPTQIMALMDLIGQRIGGWKWITTLNVPEIMSELIYK